MTPLFKIAALSVVLAVSGVGVAAAQTRPIVVPQMGPSPGVPGQNMAPPAPRQNLAPPPMRTPRPGEGDSTGRIQNDYRSRMPAPQAPQ
ncbi:hypothetical protein [Aquabacter cavernae]|uniref:hypothetical protein n=1 Tax=Aquabacter cavernae TaxID=2496029 RepID=UPI000F8DBCE5|nr:hypothetical protein [Aquabacter cavernae]